MSVKQKSHVGIAVTLVTFLALLTFFVWNGFADGFDFPLRAKLLRLNPPEAITLWLGITFLGSGFCISILTILSVVVLAARAEWQFVRQIIYTMAGAMVIENGLKWAVHRARPLELFPDTLPESYSFPSGHALFAMSFYISMVLMFGPRIHRTARMTLWVVAVLLVILIGASRIFIGVHYPSDVIGGYLAAGIWLVVMQLIYQQ